MADAYAGPDQTVAVNSVVTLTGTPAGGVWTQESGTSVTLSAPVTTSTDTKVTFVSSNASPTDNDVKVFRYTYTDGSGAIAASTLVTTNQFNLIGNVTASGNDFTLESLSGSEASSKDLVNLVGNRFVVMLPDSPTPAAQVVRLEIDPNNYIDIYRSIAWGVYVRQRVNGINSETATGYNSVDQLWASMRESGGQTYWEFSPNGTTWNIIRQVANPIALTSLRARLFVVDGNAGQTVVIGLKGA